VEVKRIEKNGNQIRSGKKLKKAKSYSPSGGRERSHSATISPKGGECINKKKDDVLVEGRREMIFSTKGKGGNHQKVILVKKIRD